MRRSSPMAFLRSFSGGYPSSTASFLLLQPQSSFTHKNCSLTPSPAFLVAIGAPKRIRCVSQSRYVTQLCGTVSRVTETHFTSSSRNPSPNSNRSRDPNPNPDLNPNPLSVILADSLHKVVYYISDVEKSEKAINLSSFPAQDESEEVWPCYIVDSVNGLVCLKLDEKHFGMFNPLTDYPIRLRDPFVWSDDLISPQHLNALKHAYGDGWDKCTICGFGWAEKSDEYKLICMRRSDDKQLDKESRRLKPLEIQIYTLGGGNTWRSIGTVPNNLSCLTNDRCGVFLNGNIHWCAIDNLYTQNHHVAGLRVVGIKTFNVEDETFGVVPVPFLVNHRFLQLGVLGGCLMIVDFTFGDPIKVWVMKDYGVLQSWTLQYIIPRPNNSVGLKLLGILQNGNLLLSRRLYGSYCSNEFLSYDPKTKTHELLDLDGLPKYFVAHSYSPGVTHLAGIGSNGTSFG